MSSIDLTNPQVLRNFLLSRMEEGKGTFSYREKVLVFNDEFGGQIVAPPETEERLRQAGKLPALEGKKQEAAEPPEVKEEPKEELLKKSEAKKVLEEAGISFDPDASREELNNLVNNLKGETP